MRNVIASGIFVLLGAAAVYAGPQTWTGQISDDMCGVKHMSMGSQKMTDRECTEMCIKANGKYVLASQGKVFRIADPKDLSLATHAGHTVNLTGELKGEAITVAKIENGQGCDEVERLTERTAFNRSSGQSSSAL